MHCYIFSDYTQCRFIALTRYIKLNRKHLKNILVPYHEAFNRICGRNSYDSNHECLEQVNLLTSKHLHASKQIEITFRLFHYLSPCLGNHKHYLKYGHLSCEYIGKLFSDNYQIFYGLDNSMCELISRVFYVQRNEPRSSRYDSG